MMLLVVVGLIIFLVSLYVTLQQMFAKPTYEVIKADV